MPLDLGVALLPNEEIKGLMMELSASMRSRYNTSYTLNDVNHPHLSLYQGTFSNTVDLQSSMRGFTQISGQEAEIVMRNLILHPSNYVTFQCPQTSSLQSLHEAVLQRASAVRMKDAKTIWERNGVEFGPEKTAATRKYGYPDAYELYDPHFTVGRITDADFNREEVLPFLMQKAGRYIGYNFKSSDLVIHELGTDGACLNPRPIEL